jgi:hypothetical protein
MVTAQLARLMSVSSKAVGHSSFPPWATGRSSVMPWPLPLSAIERMFSTNLVVTFHFVKPIPPIDQVKEYDAYKRLPNKNAEQMFSSFMSTASDSSKKTVKRIPV